jgi:hypothetical protein
LQDGSDLEAVDLDFADGIARCERKEERKVG